MKSWFDLQMAVTDLLCSWEPYSVRPPCWVMLVRGIPSIFQLFTSNFSTESMLSQLVPTLQQKSCDDPLWRRVCHSLFCRFSSLAMEPLLIELVQLLPPYVTLSLLSLRYRLVSILSVAGSTNFSFSSSLANPHPLYLLLGDLAVTNQKARLIFSHKLWLARLPNNENSAYNLIGYLMSWGAGQELLGGSLRSAMGVWSDGGSVRRMDSRQHLWLCRLLVLGTTCLSSHLTPPTSLGEISPGAEPGILVAMFPSSEGGSNERSTDSPGDCCARSERERNGHRTSSPEHPALQTQRPTAAL